MYAKSIIKRSLDFAQNEISLRETLKQYTLKIYSVEESRFYVQHLESITSKDEKGNPFFNRELYQDELNFIENERILSKYYFKYFMTHYYHIETGLSTEVQLGRESRISLYQFRYSGNIILKYLAIIQSMEVAIYLLLLKARQLGATTLSQGLINHRLLFYKDIKAMVGSSDPDKTNEMVSKMGVAWDNLPFWLSPKVRVTKSKEEYATISELNNKLIKGHGSATSGIGRGTTPTVWHLSEIPDFQDPYEDIDAALLNATHDDPYTLGIMESTAKGDSGYWYETWKLATEGWLEGKSDFCPIFLGYFLGTDLYPTKTWIKSKQFFFNQWKPKPDTISHKLKVENYVRSDSMLSSILGKNYKLPDEQAFWYETKKEAAEKKGQLAKFLEEVPSTPDEAFQNSSGSPIFSIQVIQQMKSLAKPLALYHSKPAVFGIVGGELTSHHHPKPYEIDTSRPPISIQVNLQYGKVKDLYQLIPLHHHAELWDKRLFIWEFPFPNKDPKHIYGLGTDCAMGIGQDRTTTEVIKKGTLKTPSEQVAEYATDQMSANDYLPIILAIGEFYSFRSFDLNNEAKQVIELEKGGENLQHRLQVLGWSNFHQWEGVRDKVKRVRPTTIGWATNAHTRPIIVDDVRHDVLAGFLRIHSPFLIHECKTLVDNGQRIEAKSGEWDDRYFACGMAHHSLSSWEIKKRSEDHLNLNTFVFNQETEMMNSDDEYRSRYSSEIEQLTKLQERLNPQNQLQDWQKPSYTGNTYTLPHPDDFEDSAQGEGTSEGIVIRKYF